MLQDLWNYAEPCVMPQVSHIAPGPQQYAARDLQSSPRSIPGNAWSLCLQKDAESLHNATEGVLNTTESILNAAGGRAERY